MKKSNYLLVKEVIDVTNVKELSKEFNERFKEGDNISEKEFKEMCGKYISEGGESYYINLNWKWVMSGGDNEILVNEG